MAPGTAAGAAHPVLLIGPVQLKPDDEMNRKIENDSAALMRSVTSKRGRNIEAAESAVRESKSFTDQEALAQTSHRLRRFEPRRSLPPDAGKKLSNASTAQSATLNLAGQAVVPFEMTLKEHILDDLMDPNVAFLLLAIGALALYVEFNHPGAVIPGTVGVVFILVAAFALNLLPTRFAALALMLGAFALFAAEAKFATHGVLTIGGIALLTLGGLLLVDAPIPEMRVHLVTALAISIPLGNDHCLPDDDCAEGAAEQSSNGKARPGGRNGNRTNPADAARQSLRPRRNLGRDCLFDFTPGQMVMVRRVDGLTCKWIRWEQPRQLPADAARRHPLKQL